MTRGTSTELSSLFHCIACILRCAFWSKPVMVDVGMSFWVKQPHQKDIYHHPIHSDATSHSYLWPVLLTNCPTCLSLQKLCEGNSWTNPPISQILHLTRTSSGHSFSYKFNPVLIMTALKGNLGKSLIKGPSALQRFSQQLFKKNGCGNRCPHISCCSLDLVRHNFSSQNNHTHTHEHLTML